MRVRVTMFMCTVRMRVWVGRGMRDGVGMGVTMGTRRGRDRGRM